MIVHLVDGTYELFRHFYGLRRFVKEGKDPPYGAVVGVLNTVLQMIEGGATHIGVATDHVIESFRNDLWDGYKTGEGMEPALRRRIRNRAACASLGPRVMPRRTTRRRFKRRSMTPAKSADACSYRRDVTCCAGGSTCRIP